jgi:glycosyltransferase involved in cell wall biosynthesis
VTTAPPGPVVHVVLPGGAGDPAAPSGGNRYDQRACEELAALGWTVRDVAVPGRWPEPDTAARAALATALAAIPDGAAVLLDGLVACAAPEAVEPAAARLRAVVLVHLPLADETGLTPGQAARRDAAERRTLHAAAAVVATSEAAARRLIAHHRLDRRAAPVPVHVAAPGVDAAPLAPGTPGGGQLLCVAAVTPRKGHDVLVAALGVIAGLPWRCVCAGALHLDAAHADRVRSSARAGGLDGRISFTGPRTGAALADLYAAADLLVLPSRAEPFGMVVTEALACGVPVVATSADGIPEALGRSPDGVAPGLLTPPGDPAALAAALRAWLTGPHLRDQLRTAARARRGTLTGWDATATRLAAVLTAPGGPR